MTSSAGTMLLTFLLAGSLLGFGSGLRPSEDGFTFDLSDDYKTDDFVKAQRREFADDERRYEAVVGQLFHLTLSSFETGKNQRGFVAKQQDNKGLPHWLVFNKKTGTFVGVPLAGDEGLLHVVVSASADGRIVERIDVQVTDESTMDRTSETCDPNEDKTVLSLLLDANVKTIKPKQRATAIVNVARFFKLPTSAFTLKPQLEKDDITDSSVVLAGPGNQPVRQSKSSAVLQVPVGCEGRLWKATAGIIHGLKQQARDGTISEVLALPLIGWRVKTETRPILRQRRQANDDFGSGDYDENYYDYDEEDDEYDLGAVEDNPPSSKKSFTQAAKKTTSSTSPSTSTTTSTTTTTTTTTEASTVHPHRHHHGELKPSGGEEDDVDDEDDLSVVEENLSPRLASSSSATEVSLGPTKVDIPKPDGVLNSDYDYTYEDTDETDDDPIESETIVPDILPEKTARPVFEVLDKTNFTATETATPAKEASSTTFSSSESSPTTFEIVDDTEAPIVTVINSNEPTTFVTTSSATSVAATESLTTQEETSPSTSTSTSTTTIKPTTSTTTATTTSTTTSTTTTEAPSTERILPTTESSSTTDFLTTETDTTSSSSSSTTTTVRQVSSSTTTEAVVQTVVVPEIRNTKPYIEKRLQYKHVAAGKVFRFVIPRNTFKDAEDGYNLTLHVLERNERPLSKSPDSWLQFNPARSELYGLPLSEDVSNWVYIIRAVDKEGAYEQDQLTIQVQQHRLERVVNHEFELELRIEKPQEFPHYVDWSLKILRILGRIYSTNMSEITVRHVYLTSDPVVFAWSNDSLPTTYCPRSEIGELFKMLTANDRGDPSRELSVNLAPSLRVKKVISRDLSVCEQQLPPAPPVTPTTNFSPILRNPVDQVNATLGELLIYKVKDDTFYDPEDVDPASLNITLLTAELQPIPATSWLQFDSKNREFYGIPRKTGRTEYFLLCVDTGGMSAKDSLEVVVNPPVKRQYNVEFIMTIGTPFELFSNSAALQRKFVEKLMEVFEEPSAANFHFQPFKTRGESTPDPTAVHWYNNSLPVDKCPTEEIKRLENLMHSDSRRISSRVLRIMEFFQVSTIKVRLIGNCKVAPPTVTTTDGAVPSQETTPPHAENDVMITLVLPIVIIAVMLFIAFVAACILYRKRRMGKMNMEEDGRQSYGNKGIPVIFQEELEEKPEPGTKAPVILKDEKPPLAPPEYSKSGSVKLEDSSEPYQPPPPFTRTQDNGRQPRPKPTPTYRKPPPYVPP